MPLRESKVYLTDMMTCATVPDPNARKITLRRLRVTCRRCNQGLVWWPDLTIPVFYVIMRNNSLTSRRNSCWESWFPLNNNSCYYPSHLEYVGSGTPTSKSILLPWRGCGGWSLQWRRTITMLTMVCSLFNCWRKAIRRVLTQFLSVECTPHSKGQFNEEHSVIQVYFMLNLFLYPPWTSPRPRYFTFQSISSARDPA